MVGHGLVHADTAGRLRAMHGSMLAEHTLLQQANSMLHCPKRVSEGSADLGRLSGKMPEPTFSQPPSIVLQSKGTPGDGPHHH